MDLAKRVAALTPSTTLEITAKASALKEQGFDVIGLGAGEPDYNTPDHIIDAAISAMKNGHTKYTPTGGLPALKRAISLKLLQDQNISYEASEIVVCSGAKHALYLLFQVLLNEGDEVIIPTPYWVSYPEQVKLAEGIPVYIRGSEANQFKITADQLEKAITSRTKALIINSPSNPTGMIYSKEELKALGEICVKHNILIISDEIYEKLIYGDNTHVSIAQISTELKNQTMIINGVSKSHAMTGWRIGYAAGSKEIISAMTNLASHSTSNPTSISQYATIAAYEGKQDAVDTMREAFEDRLNQIHQKLIVIPGFTCLKPQGAFYLFPNVKKAAELSGFDSVDDWVTAILEEEKVALVPGSGFGEPDYVRLSYATSLQLLEKAVERIANFMNKRLAGNTQ
jgi:aspartate aminotransferase